MKDADQLGIRDTEDGAILLVKVVPGSSRDRVVGVLGDAVKVVTSSAPEKGRANAAVARILSEALGVDKRRVRLLTGEGSPRKEFLLKGLLAGELRKTLAGL